MPKYVIERDVSGVGKLAANQLRDPSQKSCAVIKEMNAKVQWIHSYVTDDRIYCIYLAPDIDSLREHARNGGFPPIESRKSDPLSIRVQRSPEARGNGCRIGIAPISASDCQSAVVNIGLLLQPTESIRSVRQSETGAAIGKGEV